MATRYTQREILTIIEGSSVKQKSRLYLRDRVSILPLGPDFILQVGQPDQLLTSVLSVDQTEFNRVVSWGFRVETGVLNLFSILTEIRVLREQLREAEIHRLNLNRSEVLINEILTIATQDAKDPQGERVRILRQLPIGRPFADTETEFDQGGYLRIRTEGETEKDLTQINRRIRTLRGNSERLIRIYLTHEIALRRFIERGQRVPSIPEYEEILKVYDDRLNASVGSLIPADPEGPTITPQNLLNDQNRINLDRIREGITEQAVTEYFEVL